MNEQGYFIVRSDEDGTSIDGPLTEAEVLNRITPVPNSPEGPTYTNYYGSNLSFLDKIPDNNKGYWDTRAKNPILVIKGSIVTPKPVQVVQKFKL